MEKYSNERNRLAKSDSIDEIKIWKKPLLTQLDIKQTLVVDCESGMHFDRNAGGCVPD